MPEPQPPPAKGPAMHLLARRAPQDRLDPREQFTRVERFGQVIIRPQLETHDPVHLFAERGQKDHRHRALRRQPATDRQPILARHHHIEHHQIEPPLGKLAVHRRRPLGPRRPHPVLLEIARHGVANICTVINDKDMWDLGHNGQTIRFRNGMYQL